MRKRNAVIIFIGFLLVFFASSISAQENIPIPALSFQVGGSAVSSDGSVPATLKLIIFITLLSFGPAIILTTTCFTRIAIVLGLVRTTLGTASTPPNTVLAGLALFLTVSIMQPVFTKMYAEGIRPYLDGQMADEEAYKKTISPLQTFLVHHARDKDLALFLEITKSPIPESPKDVPFIVAVPALFLVN